MIEIPERNEQIMGTFREWKKIRKDLLERAERFKHTDNIRSNALIIVARNMITGNEMTTAQIRRATAIGRLKLLIDEIKAK